MKNIILNYSLLIATTCIIMISCDTKKSSIKPTTKEHMDAGFKTIENMQSAYKGEMTATAKYEAYSKKQMKKDIIKLLFYIMQLLLPKKSTPQTTKQ